MTNDTRNIETRTVRAAVGGDTAHGAVMPPLYLSTNFTFAGFDQKRDYDYTRSGNPTRDAFGDALAKLEGGAGCVVTSSGMAAIHLICQLLRPGDLLIAPHDCYGGTCRLLNAARRKRHFDVAYIDQNDPAALDAALAGKPKLILVETPSNPLLRIVDVRAICEKAKTAGSLVAADNTFLSPALQKPLKLGADIVLHSTTKYINGHSDIVGGAVIAKDPALQDELGWWGNCLGLTGAPFDSFLALRGLRTLFVRIRQQEATTQKVAAALVRHPRVEKVYYPGLPDHPGHAVAVSQQSGFGAMLSFELDDGGGNIPAFLKALACFSLAESLGGVESLIAHPATMTHAAMEPGERIRAGIGDNLLRLSIGLEDAEDLIDDLTHALDLVTDRRGRKNLAVV